MNKEVIKPNLFFIGSPKSGTTSLCNYIAEHPDVLFSNPKEPFYWSSDLNVSIHEPSFKSYEDYLKIFDTANGNYKYVAEGSTRYLYSNCAVSNIFKWNPESKFVAVLRNPIELVPAYHMEMLYSLHEDVKNLESAWGLQGDRRLGRNVPPNCAEPKLLQYGEVALQGRQIERLLSIVPGEQVLIILFDELRADTRAVYNRLLHFLDLPDDGRQEFPIANASHAHRYKWLADLVLAPPPVLARFVYSVRDHLRANQYPAIGALKKHLNPARDRDPVSDKFEEELRSYFQHDTSRLQSLINQDLDIWR